jgi:hypothetical protein
MPFQFGATPDRTTAFEFLVSVFEDFRREFEEVQYGRIMYREVIPEASVVTDINPGATEMSYPVLDWRGKGEFRALHDSAIPTVQMTADKNRIPIQVAGVSGQFDREDARQIQMGFDLTTLTEFPRVMRMACDRHVEGTTFYGNSRLNFQGFLNYTGVTVNTVPNGAAGTATWVTKTPDEIQFDINNGITTVWANSKEVHLPDTVFIPTSQYGYLSSQRMSTAAERSVMKYIKENNVYTSLTGQPLNILSMRYLDGAGAGGTDRMIVAEMDPNNFFMPFPIPFDLLDPQEIGFNVDLLAEYKFGSFHIKYPGAMSYNDGI